jgi:glutamate carboxypeptidase
VPTVLHAGDAFNVVPGRGELSCDLRADSDAAIIDVLESIPHDVGGVALVPELIRLWPGMSSEEATAPLLARAGASLGRPVVGVRRGGASDASHLAPAIPLTVDGLGPRGGKAHNPGEFVVADSLATRAEVALAVIDAALATSVT